MFFRKEASSVNNSVELMCLSSQGVWAQRTHLGEVEKGQHVSASHHPGAVDYATMLWLAREPYQMNTNSHLLEVRAMPTEFHINWTLNPSWFQFYCKTTSLWVTTAPLPDKRTYFQKLSNVFKFQEHTQTNLYAKISALNILFSWKCWKTIASRSFWFHLQPGRYKLYTHKMDLNSAGFLFTHSRKYLLHTKNTRE